MAGEADPINGDTEGTAGSLVHRDGQSGYKDAKDAFGDFPPLKVLPR